MLLVHEDLGLRRLDGVLLPRELGPQLGECVPYVVLVDDGAVVGLAGGHVAS